MKLLIDDIQRYLTCSKLFQLRRECKIPTQQYSSIDDKYIIELKQMVYFFFNQIKNNGYVNLKMMKLKWGKLWIGERHREDLFVPNEDPVKGWYRKREKDGWDVIFKLWKRFGQKDPDKDKILMDVIAINAVYMINILPDVQLYGVWPIINVVDEKTQIMDFRLNDDIGSLKRDLILTSASLAFKENFNTKEDKLLLYSLDKDRLLSTSRTDKDYRMLTETVKDFVRGIKSGVYIRAMSKRCDDCPYSYYCKEV